MSMTQYLRIIWALKWLVLATLLVVGVVGTLVTLLMPKQYTAEASLVVDLRNDPVMGVLSPGLASPGFMATQVEILKSDRVASRVVKMLGVERSPAAVQQWRESTEAKIPLERYFANLLQRGLVVEPLRGSNVINIAFGSPDAAFAAGAANAFAQAYMDVTVELRVEPTRQSAAFLDEQTKALRTNLEKAQAKLSQFQQEKGIVVSDERLDQETAKYAALTTQLSAAQAEQVEAATRSRNSGGETSPEVLQSPAILSLKGQLNAAEAKLSELSIIVGKNHPSRVQLDAQIAELKQQIAAESRRVSGGSSVIRNTSAQKVEQLKQLAEEQKQNLLALRSQRDQMAVLVRDVETAQRAYEGISGRVNMVTLEGQNTQANVRILSPAIEPYTPSRPKVWVNILGSLAGGLLLGALAALGLELLNRRVRDPEDIMMLPGVPILGVLRPADSKKPVYRRLTTGRPPGGPVRPPLLSAPGARP
jgi:chain length determinant protein EpsF